MNTRGKVALAGAVTALLVVGGAGTAYATHFQDRALPGSTLGGVSVAGMTRDEVAAAVRERAAGTTVTIDSGAAAGTRTVHLSDLGYTVDVDATVDAVFSANESWSSFATSLVSARDVDAVVTTDPARTAAVATELVEQTDRAGSDAAVDAGPGQEVVRGRRRRRGGAGGARELPGRRGHLGARPRLDHGDRDLRRRRAHRHHGRRRAGRPGGERPGRPQGHRVRRRGPAQRVPEAQGVVGDDPEHRRHPGQPRPRRREGQGLGREGGDVREGRAAGRRAQRRRRRRRPLRLHRGP